MGPWGRTLAFWVFYLTEVEGVIFQPDLGSRWGQLFAELAIVTPLPVLITSFGRTLPWCLQTWPVTSCRQRTAANATHADPLKALMHWVLPPCCSWSPTATTEHTRANQLKDGRPLADGPPSSQVSWAKPHTPASPGQPPCWPQMHEWAQPSAGEPGPAQNRPGELRPTC